MDGGGTMKQGYLISAGLLVLLGLLPVCGCSSRRELPSSGDTITIGLVMDSLVEERWTRDRNIFISTAHRRNAEVIVQIGEENAANQEAQINYLMEQGIDVLVLVASDPHHLTRAVLDVRRKGVPVLLYERIVYHAGANLLVAFDGEAVGTLQAREMLKRVGKGKILIYNGPAGDFYAEEVHRGIINTLTEALNQGTITIAENHWPKSSSAEEAFDYISAYLEQKGTVDGIIALNDLQAEAIIRALALKRLAGKVAVIGADADLAACQRIAGGTQAMTVYKPINYIASTAADLAVYLARDNRFTIHNGISDGTFRIPYYRLNPVAVTAENLDETVIRDGFHLQDEVYRNILPPE
jgi:D-xylose transport system substrate-binding protein